MKFPRFNNGKTKEATLIGPSIKQLMNEKDVYEVIERTEKVVWEAFVLVADKLQGSHKTPKYGQLVE
jgi:ribosomal protein L4